MTTGLNRALSERQVSSTRWVNTTAASGLSFGLLVLKRVQDASKVTSHAIKLATRRAIPVSVEICINLTRIYIKRFSVIASQGVPSKQLWDNGSKIVERDWES